MKLDIETLIKRLRYQGRQYSNGQISRGGNPQGPHMLEQAADELEQLRARNAELERKLAEALVRQQNAWAMADKFAYEAIQYRYRAEQAEQRITESRRQPPKFWIDPVEASLSKHDAVYVYAVGEPGFDGCTMALYSEPIVPPTVEEAVKMEREACAQRLWSLLIDWCRKSRINPADRNDLFSMVDAIRARSE